jgi:trafficking protein particle complex subunit 10
MNELQWIGLIIKPLNYSLKGGILHIDAGPGLKIEESHLIEIEGHEPAEGFEKVPIEGGKVALPDWASDVMTILWFPVHAIDESIARGTSSGANNNYIITKPVNIFLSLNKCLQSCLYILFAAI